MCLLLSSGNLRKNHIPGEASGNRLDLVHRGKSFALEQSFFGKTEKSGKLGATKPNTKAMRFACINVPKCIYLCLFCLLIRGVFVGLFFFNKN